MIKGRDGTIMNMSLCEYGFQDSGDFSAGTGETGASPAAQLLYNYAMKRVARLSPPPPPPPPS